MERFAITVTAGFQPLTIFTKLDILDLGQGSEYPSDSCIAIKLWIQTRYYISLMDVAQNLIFITSYYIYFKLLMIVFLI